jgi:Tat protein translocase TatB subunit
MFGSIGFPELVLVFIVVLLVFGPKKLPEFARWLGQAVREFRSTVDQAKSAIQEEMYKEGLADLKDVGRDVKEALTITDGIGREVKDAFDIYGDGTGAPAPEGGKKDEEKKSE